VVMLSMRLIRFSIFRIVIFYERPVFPAFFLGVILMSSNQFMFAAIVAVAGFYKGMLW